MRRSLITCASSGIRLAITAHKMVPMHPTSDSLAQFQSPTFGLFAVELVGKYAERISASN